MKDYTFNLNYTGETQDVKKHWQFCVGSGHAALAHRTDYMEQLKCVHDELNIERVRFHGIFNDDMNVCNRLSEYLPVANRNKTKVNSFYQIGSIYDNILKTGMKPFVEIGFMPTALSSGRKTIFHYKGNVTLPKDINEWQSFIKEFIEFLIHRYGKEEVRQWYFEIWNEPNLGCFFKGNQKDYFEFYAKTVMAIKSVDNNLLVGGPSTTVSQWLTEFISYCKQQNVPIDFISTHHYPSDALGHELNKDMIKKLKKIKNNKSCKSLSNILQPIFFDDSNLGEMQKGFLTENAKKAREEVGDLPLFYTEWSISSNCVASIHDTTQSSSFIVKTVLDNQGIVDGSSYWTFSDIFEEMFFFPEPFSGGFGMMTVNGIKKPSFWSFKFLSKLPNTRYSLPITNDEVEFTAFKGDDGSVSIILYAQDFVDNDNAFNIDFTVENAPHISSAKIEIISKEYGNAINVWKSINSPLTLTKKDEEYIKENSKPYEGKLDFKNTDDNISFNLSIKSNDIMLITLMP